MFAGLCSLPALRSEGASGGAWTVPQLQPGEVNKTGLTLTIDTIWIHSGGYRPVRFTVNSLTGPVLADRVLTLTFRPMQNYTRSDSVAVTQTIEIPAGSSSAEITMSVPQLCTWGMFTLDVYEDGESVKQLSIPEASLGSFRLDDEGNQCLASDFTIERDGQTVWKLAGQPVDGIALRGAGRVDGGN